MHLRIARVHDLRVPVLILQVLRNALRSRVFRKDRPSKLSIAVVCCVVRDSCNVLRRFQTILLRRIQRSSGRDHPQAILQDRAGTAGHSRRRQAARVPVSRVLKQRAHGSHATLEHLGAAAILIALTFSNRAIHARVRFLLDLLVAKHGGIGRCGRCVRTGWITFGTESPLEVFEPLPVSYYVLIALSMGAYRRLPLVVMVVAGVLVPTLTE